MYKQGCYIYGAYLSGARWDYKSYSMQPQHKNITLDALPILAIRPMQMKWMPKYVIILQ